MTNTQMLRDMVESRGLKYVYVAEKLGLSAYGLQKKIAGENDFKAREISLLAKLLGMTKSERAQIFFAEDSD